MFLVENLKEVLFPPFPLRDVARYTLLGSLLLLLLGGGACSTPHRGKPGGQVLEPIVASSPEEQKQFDEGLQRAKQGDWNGVESSLEEVAQGPLTDPVAAASRLLLARSDLGSLEGVITGAPIVSRNDPSKGVEDVFEELRQIVVADQTDPRVHFTARLYLAALYLSDNQLDESFRILAQYPSSDLSPLVPEVDQIPLLSLLAAALGAANRPLDALSSYMRLDEKLNSNALADRPTWAPVIAARAKEEVLRQVSTLTDDQVSSLALSTTASPLRDLAIFEQVRRQAASVSSQESRQTLLDLLRETRPTLERFGRLDEADALERQLTASPSVVKSPRVAVLVPLSGDQRQHGLRAQNAVLLAAQSYDSRATRSTDLPKVHFLFFDSTREPSELIEVVKKEQVDLILGPLTREDTERFAPLVREAAIPMLSLSATRFSGLAPGSYLFKFYMDVLQEGTLAAEQARQIGDSRAAILLMGNGYGRSMATRFSDRFVELGGTVVLQEVIDDASTDYSELAARVRAAAPDVLFLVALPNKVGELAAFMAQENLWGTSVERPAGLDKLNRYRVHYIGTSLLQDEQMLRRSGTYLEGALIPAWSSHYYQVPDGVPDLHPEGRLVLGHPLTEMDAVVIDAALMAKELLGKQGVSGGPAVDRALRLGDTYRGLSGTIRFLESGDSQRSLRCLELRSGRLQESKLCRSTGG